MPQTKNEVPPIVQKAALKYINIRDNFNAFFSFILDMFKSFNTNYFKILIGIILIAYVGFLFYIYFYNPYQIFSIAPIFINLVAISILMLLILTLTSMSDKSSSISILSQNKMKLFEQICFFLFSFVVLIMCYYISKRILIFSKGKSITLVVCLFILIMSLLYSINKNITKNFGIFKDILFLIPCLLVDGWDEITKDIKRAPSSTTTMLIIICSILIVYYVIPLLRKWNKISQTKFELLQKPSKLDSEVVFLTQNNINQLMIEDKSFFQKKLLEQAQIMEENIKENTLYSNSTISSNYNALEDTVIYDGKSYANNNLEFTYIKNLSQCALADISCDSSNNITCTNSDGTVEKVVNYHNMYQKCISNNNGSIFSNLFTSNSDYLTMYNDSTLNNQITFDEYCKTTLEDNDYQLKCINYMDNSNNIVVNSELIKDTTKQYIACEQLGKEVGESDTYTIISGYNDICSNEIAFECESKTIIEAENRPKQRNLISAYNPSIHRLDYNLEEQNFIKLLSPYEKNVIEEAINNDDLTLSNKLKQINDPEKIKLIYLQFLSNHTSYNTIMEKIHEINKNTKTYIHQGTSNLIDAINRKNNISDYNYHYGLSFWIYFDPEIMKMDTENHEGFILNYGNAPYIYYHYEKQELIVELLQCTTNQMNIVECNEREVVYNTKDILFQRWNHFVINYDYGTLDMFINNNLVFTKNNVSPYIQPGNNNIQFGSNDKPLKKCGICNIHYYPIPLSLNEIQNIYGKKNHPCK